MRFSVYQVSRKGGREKNEDRMGYCYTRDAGLFALADGMGGHPEGEVASQLALHRPGVHGVQYVLEGVELSSRSALGAGFVQVGEHDSAGLGSNPRQGNEAYPHRNAHVVVQPHQVPDAPD